MAIATISGSVEWMGTMGDEVFSIGTGTYQINASGEKVQWICQAPKTGSIDRIAAYFVAVANVSNAGIRYSLQDVDATTGLADGTPDQTVTSAANTPAAAGWFEQTLGSSRSVTQGDLMAIVIDQTAFAAGDDVTIGHITRSSDLGFPYGASAASSKQAQSLPIIAIRYSDGTWHCPSPGLEQWGVTSITDFSMNTGTTPDEAGLAFSFPFPARIRGIGVFFGKSSTTLSDSELTLYDDADNIVGGPITILAERTTGTTNRWHFYIFAADVDIPASTTYRATIKPTVASGNSLVNYYTFNSVDLLNTVEFGSAWYLTARTNAGAWTNYNNGTDGIRRPRMAVGVVGFDAGGSSGGGLKLAGSGGLAG